MEIQQFFYWVASIAAILFGLFLILALAVILYLRSVALKNIERIASRIEDVGKTWKNIAVSRFIIRILRIIF